MELIRPLASRKNLPFCLPQSFTCCLKPCSSHRKDVLIPKVNRRMGAIVTAASFFLVCKERVANALEMALEQSTEEAEKGVRINVKSLVEVKGLLEEESWREAQKVVRRIASNLKKDVYTIIQNKPGSERPLLRKLYSDLFTRVSKLDYAARDKDASRIWECYNNVMTALDDLLSKL